MLAGERAVADTALVGTTALRTLASKRELLLALNIVVRLAIVYWLAEAWILRDDPRFAGKAIPERNAVIVGTLALLFPAIWWFRRLPWSRYPLGLDIVYLSIYALDMAGNSFGLYNNYPNFDLIPHFHSPGAVSLIVATYWTRRREPEAPNLPNRRWLAEATLYGAGIASMIHIALEAQEYYTDVIAGTHNVEGVADTVNDLVVGLLGSLIYPPLAIRWFLPGRVRIGWLSVVTAVMLLLLAVAAMTDPLPRVTDFAAGRIATQLPAPMAIDTKAALLDAARAGAGSRGEPAGGEVRHAHDSVMPEELMAALEGEFHSIEGDVDLADGVPAMRHDPRDPVGMTFLEWLEIVAAGDFRTVKIDVKRDKVGPIIADLETAIREYGLREESLLINADVLEGPGAYGELSREEWLYHRLIRKLEDDDLIEMASAFPDAAVSIGLAVGPVDDGDGYSTDDIEVVTELAQNLRAAGAQRISVSARWDLLTDEFVEAMAAEDISVDVWNSLTIVSPEDPDAAVEQLRERYGDALGTIDLRR